MRARVAQSSLSKALKAVSKGISKSKQEVSYDGGILLSVSDGHITAISTDSVRSIRYVVEAGVDECGEVVVPGELCSKMVENMADEAMVVRNDGSLAVLECGSTVVRLHSLDPSCFQRFPEVTCESKATLPTDDVLRMVKMVEKFVSKDQYQPLYTGIHVRSDGDVLTIEATDMRRVATCSRNVRCDDFDAVIDGCIFSDAMAMVPDDMVTIGVSDTQAIISSGQLSYALRRMEGSFPNWNSILPERLSTTITFSRGDMDTALRRLKAIADTNGAVRFDVDDRMRLTASSPMSGDVSEEMDVRVDGPAITFGLQHKFMSDCIASVRGDLTMHADDSSGMVVIESDDVRYIIGKIRV